MWHDSVTNRIVGSIDKWDCRTNEIWVNPFQIEWFYSLGKKVLEKKSINQLLTKVKSRPEGSIGTDSNSKKSQIILFYRSPRGWTYHRWVIGNEFFRKVHLPRDLERILAALVLAWRILSCGFFFGLFSDDLLFEFGFSLDRLGLADPPFPVWPFPEILKSEFIDRVANSSAKSIFPSDFRFSPLKYFSAPAAISIELPLLLPVRQFVFPVVLYPVGLLIHPLSSDWNAIFIHPFQYFFRFDFLPFQFLDFSLNVLFWERRSISGSHLSITFSKCRRWWVWLGGIEFDDSNLLLLLCPLMPLPLQQKKRTTIKKSFSPAAKRCRSRFKVFFSSSWPRPVFLSSEICSLPRRDKTTLLEAKVAHAQTCFITFLQVNRWRSFRLNVIKQVVL